MNPSLCPSAALSAVEWAKRPRTPSGCRLFAMSQAPSDLLNEKLASVATDIEAIEELIVSEPLQTKDQLLALRTVQELYIPFYAWTALRFAKSRAM